MPYFVHEPDFTFDVFFNHPSAKISKHSSVLSLSAPPRPKINQGPHGEFCWECSQAPRDCDPGRKGLGSSVSRKQPGLGLPRSARFLVVSYCLQDPHAGGSSILGGRACLGPRAPCSLCPNSGTLSPRAEAGRGGSGSLAPWGSTCSSSQRPIGFGRALPLSTSCVCRAGPALEQIDG